MNRYFLLSKILVEKDGERQIDEKKIEDYKWNFDTNKSLQEIYVSMLNEYFLPLSSWEKFRAAQGKSSYEEFWRIYSLAKEEPEDFCLDAETGEECIFPQSTTIIGQTEYLEQSTPFTAVLKMNDREKEKRPDNIYESILRNSIIHRALYFYLDICQSIYYSLSYYENNPKKYFVPVINNKNDFDDWYAHSEGWKKFVRKGIDRKRKADNVKSEKKSRQGESRLSEFGVEIPLDTTFKYLNGEPMIAKFGSDVIKFFIRSEEKDTNGRRDSDILDLFSEKRKDRFTISHYEKNEIVDLLGKFYSCNKNSDIINQFLLEQCFAMDITENICDFIEIVFPADKLTKNDIKTYVAKYIDCFVAEIRRCVPTFSKLLILEETKNILFEQKYVDKDCKDYIKQGCEKLELASHVVAVLSEEMNFLHYNFYNQFIYAIIQKYNGNFENAKNDLMNEIIRTKKKLHVERYATYEYMDVRVFKAVERRKHDELFPYVQKAMMTEYTF